MLALSVSEQKISTALITKKKKEKKGEKRARERKISMLRPLVTLAKTGLTRNVSSGRFIIITWMFFIIIIAE